MFSIVGFLVSRVARSFQRKDWEKVAGEVTFTLPVPDDLLLAYVLKDSAILDYGCGYGRGVKRLKELGYSRVVGYDTCPGLVQRGISENPRLNLNVLDGWQLPEDDAAIDCVMLLGVLTSIPDEALRGVMMREVGRVLRFGGVLILNEFVQHPEFNYNDSGGFRSRLGIEMKHFAEGELETELAHWEAQCIRYEAAVTMSGRSARSVTMAMRLPHDTLLKQP